MANNKVRVTKVIVYDENGNMAVGKDLPEAAEDYSDNVGDCYAVGALSIDFELPHPKDLPPKVDIYLDADDMSGVRVSVTKR